MSTKSSTDEIANLDKKLIERLVDEISSDADALQKASADIIIETRDCWNLRDDGDFGYSTTSMSDEQLQEAIIEDLLLICRWRMNGKETGGDADHLTRFLDTESKSRVIEQIASPMVQSFITTGPMGQIDIDPEHMQAAMDFAGFWLDGWDIITDGTVISLKI